MHATRPQSNSAWWASKFAANQTRDRDTDAALEAAGWTVVRFWEHQAADEVASSVLRVLGNLGYDRPA